MNSKVHEPTPQAEKPQAPCRHEGSCTDQKRNMLLDLRIYTLNCLVSSCFSLPNSWSDNTAPENTSPVESSMFNHVVFVLLLDDPQAPVRNFGRGAAQTLHASSTDPVPPFLQGTNTSNSGQRRVSTLARLGSGGKWWKSHPPKFIAPTCTTHELDQVVIQCKS